jgi:hypothetical protein
MVRWKVTQMGSVIMGLVLISVLWGAGGSPAEEDPLLTGQYSCATPPEWIQNADEWCRYVRARQNEAYISRGLSLVVRYGGAYPVTLEGFHQSPYACLRSEDFLNPYTGLPVIEQENEPSPGNVTWAVTEGGDLILHFGYLLEGEHFAEQVNRFTADVLEEGRVFPDTPPLHEGDWSTAQKKTASCGEYVRSFSSAEFYFSMGRLPADYSEFVSRYPLFKKTWNWLQGREMIRIAFPMTGEEMDELPVPITSLSYGDFSYEVLRDGENPASLLVAVYGANHTQDWVDLLYPPEDWYDGSAPG